MPNKSHYDASIETLKSKIGIQSSKKNIKQILKPIKTKNKNENLQKQKNKKQNESDRMGWGPG